MTVAIRGILVVGYANASPTSRAAGGTQAAPDPLRGGESLEGRISLTTIYRLNRSRGRVASFDAELLEALCDVFRVDPAALLEREGHGKAAGRKRGKG